MVTKYRDGTLDYGTDAASIESGLQCLDKSLAQQSQAEETDINVIVRRFGVTGQAPQHVRVPLFEDFSEGVFDYQSAQNAIASASQSFGAMPAEIRAEFNNDPQRFLEFCSDKENLARMRKMGLAVPEQVTPEAAPVPPA